MYTAVTARRIFVLELVAELPRACVEAQSIEDPGTYVCMYAYMYIHIYV